jgi:peptidoglycan/xylan/chitin deacetylase (PgdA/CDA1 family)
LYQVALHSRIVSRFMVSVGLQRWRERVSGGGAVIMYHGVVARIDDPVLDEYAIDAASFRSHLRFFRRTHEVVPLMRIVEQLRRGACVPNGWIAITLDDALANQVTRAAEILRGEGLPWALAVPAGLIGTGRSIWTNELRFLLLGSQCPPTVRWPLAGRPELPMRSTAEKQAAVRALIPCLFDLADGPRTAYLEQLIDRAGRGEFLARLAADDRFALASWSQLEGLRAQGVELLSHGWHHRPQNATISAQALAEEVTQARNVMAERLGQAPDGFALPHGARSSASNALIAEAGYGFCLSSQPGRLGERTVTADIPRFAAEYPLPVLRRHLLQPARPTPDRGASL